MRAFLVRALGPVRRRSRAVGAAAVGVAVAGWVGVGSASQRIQDGADPAPAAAAEGGHAQEAGPARPFDHRRHERISCRECHGTGDRHRTILVRAPLDCAGCHHDARRSQRCGDCHPPEQRPVPRPVAASLSLPVWDSARVRDLPFAHELHGEVACRDCHRTPVTLAMGRECGSCHASHHRPEAECSACHGAPERSVHRGRAHAACAESGCHTPGAVPSPALSRSLCLTCHPAQRAHEPEGSCAACHKVPAPPAQPGAGHGAPKTEGEP